MIKTLHYGKLGDDKFQEVTLNNNCILNKGDIIQFKVNDTYYGAEVIAVYKYLDMDYSIERVNYNAAVFSIALDVKLLNEEIDELYNRSK